MIDPSGPDIFDRARRLISKDRNNQYGEPEDNLGDIAAAWSVYFGIPISSHDVAIANTLAKIMRTKAPGYVPDNYEDCIGYMALADRLAEK